MVWPFYKISFLPISEDIFINSFCHSFIPFCPGEFYDHAEVYYAGQKKYDLPWQELYIQLDFGLLLTFWAFQFLS